MRVEFSRSEIEDVSVPDENLVGLFGPREPGPLRPASKVIQEGLAAPVGAPRISQMVRSGEKVLVLCDDYTRPTPAREIMPHVLEEIGRGGVRQKDVRILIAGGSHPPMNEEQITRKLGARICNQYQVLTHCHDDPDALAYLGTAQHGVEIWVNRAVRKADFVVGVGGIKAHPTAGFSGGCKIILAGISGSKTIESMHYLEHQLSDGPLIGRVNNPVRRLIEEVGLKAGLDAIVNSVPDRAGNIVNVFVGHPVHAHRAAVRSFQETNGTSIPGRADVVIAEMFPSDENLMATVHPFVGALTTVKEGGVLIVAAACPDGLQGPGRDHFGILGLNDRQRDKLRDPSWVLSQAWKTRYKVGAWCGLRLPRLSQGRTFVMVSPEISASQKEKLGFLHAEDLPEALSMAFERRGRDATVSVLKRAGNLFPLLSDDIVASAPVKSS